MTTVELLQTAHHRARVRRDACNAEEKWSAAREFALCQTAIEDAIMRFNRGFAKELGSFCDADLEAEQADLA